MKKPQKGFTVIELVVVIAIIAVLSAIIVTNVQTYITKARVTKLKADFTNAAKAVSLFYSKYGSFPVGENYYNNITFCPTCGTGHQEPNYDGHFI